MLNLTRATRWGWLAGMLMACAVAARADLPSSTALPSDFFVLCYHDVQDDMRKATPGVLTISTGELINQFAWLREHGYTVISLDDLLAARAGQRPLPDKAVLLSFDDGYTSVHERVLPLLRIFNYPAVVALVGSWMDAPPGSMVDYGDQAVPRERFMSWEQVRALRDSGLVDLASHSYDLHHGVLANPQGNRLPAASSRIYKPDTGDYENDAQYRARLRADLRASVDTIRKHTGVRPRAMVWPYGAYTRPAVAIARSLSMDISLTLDDGPNRVHALDAVRRNLVANGGELSDLMPSLLNMPVRRPERVMHVDLDYVFDPDTAQQERNLDRLVERVAQMKVSTVYLQAFADPDGDGAADALYFPNRHLPTRADLFGRVAWQLYTRAGTRVYAWMPVLAYRFPDPHPLAGMTVQNIAANNVEPATGGYHRLTPFAPEARRVIGEIYEDLAKHASFAGILFHDDAVLSDIEDAGKQALQHYRAAWDLPADIDRIRADRELAARWAKAKTDYLVAFTHELADRVRQYRPAIRTARNIYARVVLQPEAEHWFAQSYPAFLRAYDYTVVMAMPGLEKVPGDNAAAWLRRLAQTVVDVPAAADRTVFELQAKDWQTDRYVDPRVLAEQIRTIHSAGIFHFGYYPDDFLHGQPALETIRPAISLETFPYPRWRP